MSSDTLQTYNTKHSAVVYTGWCTMSPCILPFKLINRFETVSININYNIYTYNTRI